MRLDKFLSELNIGTRSQVKDYIRKGLVCVNGAVVRKADQKIDELQDTVMFRDEPLSYQKYFYFMLHKPGGVVSATKDNTASTVLDLIPVKRTDLFPVGRLDKDTEGLLIITNDGGLAHDLLSPRKHVDKTYLVTIAKPLKDDDILCLEQGVDIGDEKPTAPARVNVISDTQIHLTIHEGRFHQVKRMLQAVQNEVVALKRISFGPLRLDETLMPGSSRELTPAEVAQLYEASNDSK